MQSAEQPHDEHRNSEGADEESDHGDNGGVLGGAGEQDHESHRHQESASQRENGCGTGEDRSAEGGED